MLIFGAMPTALGGMFGKAGPREAVAVAPKAEVADVTVDALFRKSG